jgi:hypothetical protein
MIQALPQTCLRGSGGFAAVGFIIHVSGQGVEKWLDHFGRTYDCVRWRNPPSHRLRTHLVTQGSPSFAIPIPISISPTVLVFSIIPIRQKYLSIAIYLLQFLQSISLSSLYHHIPHLVHLHFTSPWHPGSSTRPSSHLRPHPLPLSSKQPSPPTHTTTSPGAP